MAIRGVSRKPIAYIPEDERSEKQDPTVIWIKPKTGHDANVTMSRYAATGRDVRKGYRELNVNKLDNADVQEFLDIVVKVENYFFSDQFPDLQKQGLFKVIEDETTLRNVCMDISADLLIEIFEVANNLVNLKAGEKKDYSSQHISHSGKGKKEQE